ncbi:MAG: tRNA preQ1(34) S-adenosylmethionine ribosyltransferase-isomerase QueA [Desulforhopalus sp.]|nr:tRNA preQ1(34) S-adenosylmethionine ribosyltransferase-isomerase QueA [Desulforhopalus sp.]
MQEDLTLSSYNYHLPEQLIAQHPAEKRDNSRLMVVHPGNNEPQHCRFSDIGRFIGKEDMLVVNDTRVFPARLLGQKETGGKAEVFLLEFPVIENKNSGTAVTNGLIKSSKRPKTGAKITINEMLSCTVIEDLEDGKLKLSLQYDQLLGLAETLKRSGQVPLPPYISRKNGCTTEDVHRYQTVYASQPGAVAAPTAGLHFTDELLRGITEQGTLLGQVTLHVGYGTFAPVRETDITRHQIHREYLSISQETVDKIALTKKRGGKIWAVGTTTVRALEYGAKKTGRLEAIEDWCDLYIYPGFQFKVIDNLITNFHLPDSSLMFLVSALCGRETLLDCYKKAIKEQYRFFSYGDAMAIISEPSS